MLAWLNLGLCVFTTSFLLIGLRAVGKFKLDLVAVVGVNYLVAATTGFISFPNAFGHVFAHPELSYFAIIQGSSFLALFLIMGILSSEVGLGFMTIIAKMSLLIPVLFSWLVYGDEFTIWHFAGIVLALLAITLVNLGENKQNKISKITFKTGILALILFLGSGGSDAIFKHINQTNIGQIDSREYIIVLFAVAGIMSLPVLGYRLLQKQVKIDKKTLAAGLAIGIPNYFSIVFLSASLQYFDGTVFYPINNTAVLLLTTLFGILIFQESVNRFKIAGILLAILAGLMLV